MADHSFLAAALLKAQNSDGGWSYGGSLSWTEPTSLAVLALSSTNHLDACERGCRWLLTHQRADGGWPPNPEVEISTSVTSQALLALGTTAPRPVAAQGIEWLVQHIHPEMSFLERCKFWWQDMPPEEAVMGGSPWFPGTASWVEPTVMAIAALSQYGQSRADLIPLLSRGRHYLLSRRCSGGGWNQGGTHKFSEGAVAYPEMTGMALLAFPPRDNSLVASDLELAARMLSAPQSAEGESWLRLALAKHNLQLGSVHTERFRCRTVRDISLRLLAIGAETGSIPVLGSV